MSIEQQIETAVKSAIGQLEHGSIEDLKGIIRDVMQEDVKVQSDSLKDLVKEALREELLATAKAQKEGLMRLLNVA